MTAVPQAPSIDLDHELSRGFAARYIRRKSRQMLGHTSLRKADRPDIEQELKMEVWRAAPNFDPSAGDWESFVATIVERHAAQYLIRRRTEKRCLGNDIDSLDILVTDADGIEVTLASQMRPEHRSAVTGVHSADELEQTDVRIDVEALLAPLSDRDREVLYQLAILSQSEVAQVRGVSRRTVREALERAKGLVATCDEITEKADESDGADSSPRPETHPC